MTGRVIFQLGSIFNVTPAVNKLLNKLQILFLVIMKQRVATYWIQVIWHLQQILHSWDILELRK